MTPRSVRPSSPNTRAPRLRGHCRASLRSCGRACSSTRSPLGRSSQPTTRRTSTTRKAEWHYNGVNVTIPETPRTPGEQAIVDQNFAKLILEQESDILRNRPTLPQKDFSNEAELKDNLLSKSLDAAGVNSPAQTLESAEHADPSDHDIGPRA